MAFVPKATSPPKIERISNRDWLKGTVTAYDDGRTPVDGLRSSGNVILQQDGTIRPRPSLTQYGPQPTGTILGEIYEFRARSNNTFTNWLISMQNVAGTTKVYIAKGEDTSWTVCNGKTYDNTARAHFLQIQDKVLVMNGVDNLSYLNIPTSAIIPYTALSTPSVPTVANNGSTDLTTGTTSFNVYYAITANSTVGETAASTVATKAVNTDRDLWNPSTNSLKITWSAVTSAQSYNVYMGVAADGAGTPTLYAIATGIGASTLAFIDDGSYAQDLSRPKPTVDSTAGPKVTRGDVVNGRVWLVGDKDNPFYVWRGGDYGFELDLSPANGGGYTPVGNGTKEFPVKVAPYRDGKGDAKVTVLTQGTNGHGHRYIGSPQTVTFGDSSFIVWAFDEDSGQDGTDSPDGVIIDRGSIFYPSRDGFKTTGTKPQLQNVLSTDRISNTIQPDISTLNNAAMDKCVGLSFEGRLYWAVPVGSTTNSEIWVLDLDRDGAWMKPWNIAADWLTLYNDNSGVTHFLVLKGNKIYQLSYIALTADDGTAFGTSGNSGQIYFSKDGREWGRLVQVIFTLLRPQGSINFTILGKTEDSALSTVGTGSFTPTSTQAGWSEPLRGWSNSSSGYLRGWSEIVTVPVSFNDATQEVTVEVDEDLQWWGYQWTTTDSGVDYNLSNVTAEFVNVGIKDLA